MKNLFIFLAIIVFSKVAFAENLKLDLDYLDLNRGDVKQAVIEATQKGKTVKWQMSQVDMAIFISKLVHAPKEEPKENPNKLQPINPEPSYMGVKVILTTSDNKDYDPITVYDGKIKNKYGKAVAFDPDRNLEYWIFGTAYLTNQQFVALDVLPIISYQQCVVLGNQVIGTSPRQCVLADGTIFLETDEKPTHDSLNLKNFDDCLLKGKAIVNTFPRRCIASGGRIYTEPPKIMKEKPVEETKPAQVEVPANN